jgi:hypothetical protein
MAFLAIFLQHNLVRTLNQDPSETPFPTVRSQGLFSLVLGCLMLAGDSKEIPASSSENEGCN